MVMRRWMSRAVGSALLMLPWMACADDLSWRATSVQGPRLPGVNTRIGVAIFNASQPATFERKVSPVSAPADGRMVVDVESSYRFADGSTLLMRSRETLHLTPQGTHGRDEWSGEGEVVAGTGRYAGASGRFSFRAVMGLDGRADGMVGDSFLEGQAKVATAAPTK